MYMYHLPSSSQSDSRSERGKVTSKGENVCVVLVNSPAKHTMLQYDLEPEVCVCVCVCVCVNKRQKCGCVVWLFYEIWVTIDITETPHSLYNHTVTSKSNHKRG
jgi:hypothetical protein